MVKHGAEVDVQAVPPLGIAGRIQTEGRGGKTRVKKKGLGQPGEPRRNTPLVSSRFHQDENGRSVERSTYVQQPLDSLATVITLPLSGSKNVATRNHRRTRKWPANDQKDIRETSLPLSEFPLDPRVHASFNPRQPVFPRLRRENWNARGLLRGKKIFFLYRRSLEQSQREPTAVR